MIGQLNAEHAMAWLRDGQIGPDPRQPEDPVRDWNARHVRACFTSHPEVLELILKLSLFRAPVDYRMASPEYEHYAQLRQGQNQLAATLLAYMAHAEDLDRRPPHAPFDAPLHGPDDGAGRPDVGASDRAADDPTVALS